MELTNANPTPFRDRKGGGSTNSKKREEVVPRKKKGPVLTARGALKTPETSSPSIFAAKNYWVFETGGINGAFQTSKGGKQVIKNKRDCEKEGGLGNQKEAGGA